METGSESKGMIKAFSKCKAKDVKCERLLTELKNIKHYLVPHVGHVVLEWRVF